MSIIAEAVRHMLAAGMNHEAIVDAVAAMELASQPQTTKRQERNRRYYERKASEKRLKASELDASDDITPPSSDGFPPYPLSLTTPSLSQKPPKGVKKGFQIPDWISEHDWNAYVEMRGKIRKPMTDEAKRLAVLELENLKARGQPPDRVLQQSTMNSWQGLFELKTGAVKSGKSNVKTLTRPSPAT